MSEPLLQSFREELLALLQRLEAELLGLEEGSAAGAVDSVFRTAHDFKSAVAMLGLQGAADAAHALESDLDSVRRGPRAVDHVMLERLLARVDALRAAIRGGETGTFAPGEMSEDPGVAVDTLVVGTRRVDALMDLCTELRVATGWVEHLRQEGVSPWDSRLEGACQEALKLAGRVHEAALAIRLIPLEPTFLALRRFVRETAGQLGKQVEVELRGGQTELDKSVAERLMGPLKHLVRNALDHGIELPAERAAAGKPQPGRLMLSAQQERGQVLLAVEDDGRGIDPERIRAVAVAQGILDADAVLPEADALQLLFRSGFSTASKVGVLSGRGVGLDVVRRNLMDLGGDIQVWSRPGQGARFILSVPMTLATLDVLVVRVGAERLLVPRDSVERLVWLRADDIARLPNGRCVLRLPDRTIPLLRPDVATGRAGEAVRGDGVALIPALAGAWSALQVDEVLSQESILLKPLHRGLRMAEGVLGAAVLGDGQVALVLDLASLMAHGDGTEVPVLHGRPISMATRKVG